MKTIEIKSDHVGSNQRCKNCNSRGPLRSHAFFNPSYISLHVGQIGNFSGSREGTHFLPHKAVTGLPVTIASVIFSFRTYKPKGVRIPVCPRAHVFVIIVSSKSTGYAVDTCSWAENQWCGVNLESREEGIRRTGKGGVKRVWRGRPFGEAVALPLP